MINCHQWWWPTILQAIVRAVRIFGLYVFQSKTVNRLNLNSLRQAIKHCQVLTRNGHMINANRMLEMLTAHRQHINCYGVKRKDAVKVVCFLLKILKVYSYGHDWLVGLCRCFASNARTRNHLFAHFCQKQMFPSLPTSIWSQFESCCTLFTVFILHNECVCVCLCASWVATHFCLLPFGICVPFRTFITVIALSRYALFLSPFYLFFGGIDSGMWYDDVDAIDQKTWHKCAHVNLKNHSTENYGVTSNALSHCITTTKWKTHIQNVYTPFWIFHATKLQWRIMCSLIYMTLSNW